MKLFGEGGIPKPFVMYGELKSSISSLKMMPVDLDMTFEPKLKTKKQKKGMRNECISEKEKTLATRYHSMYVK